MPPLIPSVALHTPVSHHLHPTTVFTSPLRQPPIAVARHARRGFGALSLRPPVPGVGAVSLSGPWVHRHGARPASSATAAATTSDERGGGCADDPPPSPSPSSADFLAPPGVSFESLGLPAAIADGLRAAGLARPSAIAASAARPLLEGRDVVLAAETGSGKTLAYLAPLIARLRGEVGDSGGGEGLGLLVLTPNAALADQVVSAAAAAFPGLTASRVSGSATPPPTPPDLLVATPAGLLGTTYTHGTGGGPGAALWSPQAVVARVRAVVLDEADALLGGGYAGDTDRVLFGLRAADDAARTAAAEAAAGLEPGGTSSLPRKLRRAAREGGAAGFAAAGGMEPGSGEPAATAAAAGAGAATPRPPGHVRQYVFCAATLPPDPREDGTSGLGGAGAPPSRARVRQGAPAGGALRARFPGAAWVTGAALHRALPRVTHAWVDVEADEGEEGEVAAGGGGRGGAVPRTPWKDALIAAVVLPGSGAGAGAGAALPGRTLVFCRDPKAAARAADALRDAGLAGVVTYTAADRPADRAAILAALAAAPGAAPAAAAPSILVATDAAARGLDVPGLSHVVQAHFAANAIDFLHRVGRTARAGGAGRVTSLVGPASADLAAAVRGAVEAGSPLEGAFSRKRSFRRKLRRYGEYVPRGQKPPVERSGEAA